MFKINGRNECYRLNETFSIPNGVWTEAEAEDDFNGFAPFLTISLSPSASYSLKQFFSIAELSRIACMQDEGVIVISSSPMNTRSDHSCR